ncbi:hypothetical protein AAZX31_06G205100 [Glycine max]
MLRNLSSLSSLCRCVIGNFNDILSPYDKCGRMNNLSWLINGFRRVVLDCNMVDIPMVGYPFTWSSSKGIVNGVEERLDRAMVTSVWFEYYPNVELRNSISSILDRSLIILATQEALNHYHMRRRFILKNAWLLEEDVEEMVKGSWNNSSKVDFSGKI